MKTEQQLKQLLKQGIGKTFYSFANADGKRWWMPARHMAIAMNLYQPSGVKGKLLKRGLPWLHWNPVVRKVLHAERMQLAMGDELKDLLEGIFGKQGLEFAIFGGTPCVHQKITIQLSRGSRILGYVKVTESEEIYRIFKHEKKVLDALHVQGIEQVSVCLYCGTMKTGLYVFVQSTIKTQQSKVVHTWSDKHEKFLNSLAMHTQQKLAFEKTDFCRDLNILEQRLPMLGNPPSLSKAIKDVRGRYAGKEVSFSAFQADFTPWNMFVEKGQLFVFDWEYARMTYPPRLDYFHFMIQTAIFEEHLSAEEIARRYDSLRSGLTSTWKYPDQALQCYLLAIMSIYLQREQRELGKDAIRHMDLWINILKNIQ